MGHHRILSILTISTAAFKVHLVPRKFPDVPETPYPSFQATTCSYSQTSCPRILGGIKSGPEGSMAKSKLPMLHAEMRPSPVFFEVSARLRGPIAVQYQLEDSAREQLAEEKYCIDSIMLREIPVRRDSNARYGVKTLK